MSVMVSWVAAADYRAMRGASAGLGPVAQALSSNRFARAVLLNNYDPADAEQYLGWVAQHTRAAVRIWQISLDSPIDYVEMSSQVSDVMAALSAEGAPMTVLLSPGTPTMAAIWLLLAKTRFPASLIQTVHGRGIIDVELPFDIAVDFMPEVLAARDRRLQDRLAEDAPLSAAFDTILHRSPSMGRVLRRARRAASRDVPVLIEGESGTGKELLARAIHNDSARREQAFVAINCGAIPSELVESALFGHERGAFTGADRARPGRFRAAHRGTLFLDEVGELPLNAQVKLLRALQEGEVTPVGAIRPQPVDVRIIAATHRQLLSACQAGRFRFDLFYRLAVAVLRLPPLRERSGDLSLLVDHILDELGREAEALGEPAPKLSVGARQVIYRHAWPGNVRELRNTLRRACLWSPGVDVSAQEMTAALLLAPKSAEGVLDQPLGEGFSLPDLLREVAAHYLRRALDESGGNKTAAAKLVGLSSYQTLTNWLKRYAVNTGE